MINPHVSAKPVVTLPQSQLLTLPPAPTNQLLTIPVALPGLIHSELPSTQLPLLLSIENLNQMVSQLQLITNGQAPLSLLQGVPGPTAALTSPTSTAEEFLTKLLETIAPPTLEVLPLHQLATFEDRSLAQAVQLLRTNAKNGGGDLLLRIDSFIEGVTGAVKDALLAELSNLSKTGLDSRFISSSTNAVLELPGALTTAAQNLHKTGASTAQHYVNRFISQRARKQEYLGNLKPNKSTMRRSLPEHILQILARIVVRVFGWPS